MALIPWFPFKKCTKFDLFKIGCISTLLTLIVLIYLFINRVIVKFYIFDLDDFDITFSDIREIESIELENRANELNNKLNNTLFYPLYRDNEKNVKVILFNMNRVNTNGKKRLDKDKLKYLVKHDLKDKKTIEMTFVSAIMTVDWRNVEKEQEAIKRINTTRFSNKKEYYTVLIGVFDLLNNEDNLKLITRPIKHFNTLFEKIYEDDLSLKLNIKSE